MSRVLGGFGVKVGVGVVCGLASTAWFAGHHRDGGFEATSGGGAALSRASSSHGGGLSRWIPWNFLGESEPETLAEAFGGAIPGKRVDVSVTVVDLDGRPVSGADVQVKANAAEYATANLSDADYESVVKLHPEYEGSSDEASTVTVERGRTDRNGVWQVKLKPGVALTFLASDSSGRQGDAAPGASALGYEGSSDESGALADSRTPQSVQIEIAPPATVIGQVVDEAGRPIADASISLSDLTGRSLDDGMESGLGNGSYDLEAGFRTSHDGSFRISLRHGGAFDVQATAPGYRSMTEPAVQVLPGQETHVDLTLQTAAQLAGVVVGPDGAPMQGVSVQATVDGDGSEEVPDGSGSGYTDEDGAFKVDGLAPGRYLLTFTASGMLPKILDGVQTGGGSVRAQLSAGATMHLAIDASRDLLGGGGAVDVERKNYDDEGSSGAVAQVFLATLDDTQVPIGDAQGLTPDQWASHLSAIGPDWRQIAILELDENGHGEQDVPALPAGRFRVAIRVGDTWSTPRGTVALYDGGSSDFRARLPDGTASTMVGVVRDADGRAAGDATVWLEGGPMGSTSTVTDESGRFSFGSFPQGSYQLMVESAEGLTATQPVDATRGGRIDFDVTLPAQNATVAVPDEGQLTDTVIPPQQITVDDVVITDSASPSTPAQWKPPIKVEPTDRGLVVLAAPAPAAGGPRLFGGDRVVAIEGTDVSSMDPYDAMNLLAGQANSTCSITVDRPATHQTLTVRLARTSEDVERYEVE